jgi:hypothetical protein
MISGYFVFLPTFPLSPPFHALLFPAPLFFDSVHELDLSARLERSRKCSQKPPTSSLQCLYCWHFWMTPNFREISMEFTACVLSALVLSLAKLAKLSIWPRMKRYISRFEGRMRVRESTHNVLLFIKFIRRTKFLRRSKRLARTNPSSRANALWRRISLSCAQTAGSRVCSPRNLTKSPPSPSALPPPLSLLPSLLPLTPLPHLKYLYPPQNNT